MSQRDQNLRRLESEVFDVAIVGAGINGAVCAAAVAARGGRVVLVDSRDFAGFTSQHSSNLIWGGIKYMENYEFGLVNDLCKSRNDLLESFPSTVQEIRFLTTITKNFRFHPWIMYAGTWLYWLFGRGKTEMPRLYNAAQMKAREPLIKISDGVRGIEYSDAYLHDNDSRFVFNFVRSAVDHGAVAVNYLRSAAATRETDHWVINAENCIEKGSYRIKARVMVNAAGAFTDEQNRLSGIDTEHRHLFSKGVHLIVPRLSEQDRVLAFFADDGRLFFAIPMGNCTCIGTTDALVEDPVTEVTDEDREFILSNINARLEQSQLLTRDDIISERCGVRPLVVTSGAETDSNFLQLSRKHVVETNNDNQHISIFGGKLTDCINVSEEVCNSIIGFGVSLRVANDKWYGEPDAEARQIFFDRAKQLGIDQMTADDTGEKLSTRLWRRYGDKANGMLDSIESDSTMTDVLIAGTGFRRCELRCLAEDEMIVRLEDLLRRRTKLEMLMSYEQLRASDGLKEICAEIFGDQAEAKYQEYFSDYISAPMASSQIG